jgi:DNA-binding IclR family transcriptional regulator
VPETSKTVDQALNLLRSIADGGAASVGELARRLGLNRTVVYRLVATLEGQGFLSRHGDRLHIGPTLLHLSDEVEPDLRAAARPVLVALCESTGETALLAVADNLEWLVVDQVVGVAQVLRVQYRPGFHRPLTLAASGLAILAFATRGIQEAALHGVDDPDSFTARLRDIRAQGYAFSSDELGGGAWGVAAPVHSRNGDVVGSVGWVAPLQRKHDLTILAKTIIQAGAETTTRLRRNG